MGCEMWPKRRPSTSPCDEEKRWSSDASVGPVIAIFSNGRSSSIVECKRYGNE